MTFDMNLNRQAAAMLHQLQKQTGVIPPSAEQAIAKATETNAGKQLSAAQLTDVLVQAMPDSKDQIEAAKCKAAGYHCDGKNGQFLTAILGLRIEKDFNVVHIPRPPPPRLGRDPYYTELSIDPKADFVFLFNARDVDRDGKPLLMKVVARERADVTKLDLSEYRTSAKMKDIERIANDCDYVEVKDTDETEFEFGDPLKQISFDKSGCEISSSVAVKPRNIRSQQAYAPLAGSQTEPDLKRPVGQVHRREGDNWDTTPVVRFNDRIHYYTKITDDFVSKGGWINSSVAKDSDIEVGLKIDRGFMFEPGSTATFSVGGTNFALSVAEDDAQLLGSSSASVAFERGTLLEQLTRWPGQFTVNAANERGDTEQLAKGLELLGAYPAELCENVKIGGAAFRPLSEPILKNGFEGTHISASKVPLPGDPDSNGQRVSLSLDSGFLASENGTSFKGWKVVAGYTDLKNKWHGGEPMTVDCKAFSATTLTVDVENAPELLKHNRNIEIRVFNPDNIPAQSVNIPIRSVKWGS